MDYILKHEDAFEHLSALKKDSVSLILTDPPYEISRPSGYISSLTKPDGTPQSERTIRRFAVDLDFGEWDKQQLDLLPYIEQMYRVLKPSGTLVLFYDLWKITPLKEMLTKSKFKQIRLIEWIKTNPVPLNSRVNYLTNAREVALTAVKGGKPTFNSEYDNGVYRYPIYQGKDRFHNAQKSLPLFEQLVLKHSNEGDLVVDPFAGSATAAIAALKHKRDFSGCEMDEGYYIKSIERIERLMNEQN